MNMSQDHKYKKDLTFNISRKYNPARCKSLIAYSDYLNELISAGATRIVHSGYGSETKRKQLREMLHVIREKCMVPILYMGVFGTENLESNPFLEKWAQRNTQFKALGYGGSRKSAMMCPVSPYVSSYLLPKVLEVINECDINNIFLDIPWIMKGGCHCGNCYQLRQHGADNARLVRLGLEQFVNAIRAEFPCMRIAVNASAPGIYSHRWRGAEIENLGGLFDEYVTEWNPFRWRQKPDVITRCVREARKRVQGKFYHATTLTDKDGKMYDTSRIADLFMAILRGGALPWLGIACPEHQISQIGEAWRKSLE